MNLKQVCKYVFLLCAISSFNLQASDGAAVPAALSIPDVVQGAPGISIDADVLREVTNSLGLPAAAKEISEGCGKLASAIQNSKIQVSFISASDVASLVGGAILCKSLYEGLWGQETEEEKDLRLNLLKEASSNIVSTDSQKKKSLSGFIKEYRNWIGGIVGLLLLCNKKIINL